MMNVMSTGAFTETSFAHPGPVARGVNGINPDRTRAPHAVLNLENNLGLLVQGTDGRIDARGARCTVHRFGAAATYSSHRSAETRLSGNGE